ncbi:Substrate-binding region of ABC-type glycine betaine transport system [Beutenbergia cavernae DSM 12333]|uniref:Substrate-binding region of ABC-type glycine betaine transport system n=1 Tax=Beutenbergia cavernae (strain ATCC BAA-8 / DSM 12333 / CCUG 43141 / JCM 11478 / NBRC 16432 / NCIMB 13614 / HKI 0122) TaxID=471853 RepID=C5C5F0_BEUC1|nr:glycine betaine ABC transporter substrate-binding protein [Beutenbergia cavernae]ACQ82290.1 Substrate-binding region of ABC-type glycine betaine transport system [Beutenbergia cavernae DSM 12333]
MRNRRTIAMLAATTAGALGLAACSSTEESAAEAPNGDVGEITLAAVPGWDDTIASSVLWEAVLEEQGYDVTIEYIDVAPAFIGVSSGTYDLYLGSWLPTTHGDYYEQYGDDMEVVGVWNRDARNTFAVNADAPIDSIEDLAENADLFENRIIGVEAGAGLTRLVEDDVIPTYGLEEMEFVTSSTPAMLAELDGAMASGDDILVTLWQPHWAYGDYDLKNLEDPEGTLGGAEEITILSRTGFADDAPVAHGWLSDFEMDLDLFATLEAALFQGNETTEYDDQIATWIDENREWVDTLTP